MLKSIFAQKNRFTGLEIDNGYIKLAQGLETGGKRKIVNLIIKKLDPPSEKETVEALKSLVRELKSPLGHLILVIPRHKVTVRFLRFPSANEKEIEGMVRFQAAKELPFSKEEIISDYLVAERTKDGYAKVAIVIAHLNVVRGYLESLKKANLEPERITFSSEALLGWYKTVFWQEKAKGCFILIDPDSDNTDIVVVANYHLGFTRGVNLGTAQLVQRPQTKQKLLEEIRRTIMGYLGQEKEQSAQKIIFAQEGPVISELSAFLEGELKLTAEIFSPWKNLAYKQEISAVQYPPGLSLLRVLGAVLDTKGKRINLMPRALRERRKVKQKKKKAFTTLVLIMGIILTSTLSFAKKLHDQQLHIAYLAREISHTAAEARQVEEMLKKIELINDRRKVRGSCIDVLSELHELTPQDVSLTSFSYEKARAMVALQGISTNMSQIFYFTNILEKSGYFRNVQLKYVSEKKAGSAGFIDFKIECILEG